MPHNLYLHSALVQTRRIGRTLADKREACRFNFFDSFLALNGAMIVNAAILVLAAAVFFKQGVVVDRDRAGASMLSPLLGTTLASVLFAIALLASGQSSTLTGTFAGQIVMEGFLDLRMRPWLRRLVTRSLAIIPAVFTVMIAGEQGTLRAAAAQPGDHQHAASVRGDSADPVHQRPRTRWASSRIARGSSPRVDRGGDDSGSEFLARLGRRGPWMIGSAWRIALVGPVILALSACWDGSRSPERKRARRESTRRRIGGGGESAGAGVSADPGAAGSFRSRDRAAIAHAAAMARLHGATLHLLHVEEGVTSQFFGALSSTAEIQAGEQYFRGIVRIAGSATGFTRS